MSDGLCGGSIHIYIAHMHVVTLDFFALCFIISIYDARLQFPASLAEG